MFKPGDMVVKYKPYNDHTWCRYGGSREEYPIGWVGKVIEADSTEILLTCRYGGTGEDFPVGWIGTVVDGRVCFETGVRGYWYWWFHQSEFTLFDSNLEKYKANLRKNV